MNHLPPSQAPTESCRSHHSLGIRQLVNIRRKARTLHASENERARVVWLAPSRRVSGQQHTTATPRHRIYAKLASDDAREKERLYKVSAHRKHRPKRARADRSVASSSYARAVTFRQPDDPIAEL